MVEFSSTIVQVLNQTRAAEGGELDFLKGTSSLLLQQNLCLLEQVQSWPTGGSWSPEVGGTQHGSYKTDPRPPLIVFQMEELEQNPRINSN